MEEKNLKIKENVMKEISEICMNSPLFVDKIQFTNDKIKLKICKLDKNLYNQILEIEYRYEDWDVANLKEIIEKTFIIIKKEREKNKFKKTILKFIKK